MKKLFLDSRLLSLLLLLSAGVFLSSCDDDDITTPPADTTSVTAKVIADADFSMLEQAVITADLATTLSANTTDGYTVFAPNNAAFTKAGLDMAYLSNATNKNAIANILKYHVLGAEVKAAAVPAGPNAAQVTLQGDSVFLTRNTNGVFINGVKVTAADVDASNGVIHKIESLLMPPKASIVAEVSGDTDLSILLTAIQYADTEESAGLATLLSGSTEYTVFAPTNAALIAALDGANGSTKNEAIETAELASFGASNLVNLLKNHVVAGQAFSSDLSDNQKLNTLQTGEQLTIDTDTDDDDIEVEVKSSGITDEADVIKANIVTKNGVVHKIDKVLLIGA